jgi:hypothetical protein
MILLIWPSERSQECAQALQREFDQPVKNVSNLDAACEELKSNTFSAVVLDHWLCEASPAAADLVLQHIGSSVPIIVNFAISSLERVVRTVRMSLHQHKREMELARQHACMNLKSELKDDLTELFLSCGIGLQDPTLPAQAADQLRRIEEIGKHIQQRLAEDQALAAHA